MSAWTKEAPKRQGWYWCRVRTHGLQAALYNGSEWFGCANINGRDALELVGPRIPSPETLVRLAEFLRDATTESSDAEERADRMTTARALLEELEGSP